MSNAKNSISEQERIILSCSELIGFNTFWGSTPPSPLDVRSFGAGKTCLVCYGSLSGCAPPPLPLGGWQLFPTEFGKLCVPLKKSWLRP